MNFKVIVASTLGLMLTTVNFHPVSANNLSNPGTEIETKLSEIPSLVIEKPESFLTVQARINLTGRWRGNDGGIYYIRQIGNELWWYGQSRDSGNTWSNVFHAKINRRIIRGNWADVPKGRIRQSGKLTLQIINARTIRAVSKTGGFGGSQWSRI